MASVIVLHRPSLSIYPRNIWPKWSSRPKIWEELGPHLIILSRLYHLHQWINKCRGKKWRGCCSHQHMSSYSTYCCVNYQSKGTTANNSYEEETDAMESALLWILTNANSAYTSIITMWNAIIMQPSHQLHLSNSPFTIHFINQPHTMSARSLQYSWQWPRRQSSKRSHHFCIWHHPPYISIMCFSGHQQNVPWWTTSSRLNK